MDKDTSFGPQWGSSFDFTLEFESWFFTLAPAALVIAVTPLLTWRYLSQAAVCCVDRLFWFKSVFGFLHVCASVIVAALWAHSSVFPTPSAPVAVALYCVGALCITSLILLSHRHAMRSSALISIYLSISFLLAIAKSRSFVLRHHDLKATAALSIFDTVLLLGLVVLEEFPKTYVDNEKEQQACRDMSGGFWNRTTMIWLNTTLWAGFKGVLSMAHLAGLSSDFASMKLSQRFDICWKSANKESAHALLKTCLRALAFEVFSPIISRLVTSAFNFTQPWLMRRLLHYINDLKAGKSQEKGGLMGAFLIAYLGLAISKTATAQMINVLLVKLRGVLTAQVLRKSLRLRQISAKDGGPLALMTTDIENVVNGTKQFYDVLVALPEIAVALYLLSREIGEAFFLPISTVLFIFVSSHLCALKLGPASALWNQSAQARLEKMMSVLSQMKAIKMMGLEPAVTKYMRKARWIEIMDSRHNRRVIVVMTALLPFHFAVTPTIVVAGGLFWTKWKSGLDAATLFPTLVLVVLLSQPLSNVVQCWPKLAANAACFKRVQAYLLLEDRADPRSVRPLVKDHKSSVDEKSGFVDSQSDSRPETADRGILQPDSVLAIKSANIGMRKDGDAILQDVSLTVDRSTLVMVVGPVGCGKSIILRTILGETFLLGGSVDIEDVRIGFCDQQAWLPNVTVKNAILGESAYDKEWYQTVLRACMLEQDVEKFIGGDGAMVGSNGSRLSGGQRQRVTLARAVYSRSPVLIFDDVLSALDQSTARGIFKNLFGQDGLLKRGEQPPTTIMATHSIEFLNAADKVIVIDDNKSIVTQETSDVIQKLKDQNLLSDKEEVSLDSEEELPPIMKDAKEESDRDDVDALQAKQSLGGSMELYRILMDGVPVLLFSCFMIVVLCAGLLESGINIYLRAWIEVAPTDKIWFIGPVAICVASIAANAFSSWSFSLRINPYMAFNMHDKFLTTVVSASLSFLTATSNGNLLNRASQDMAILSRQLPDAFYNCIFGAFCLIGVTAMITAASKYAVIVMPIMLLLVYILTVFYLRTSRQMRYLDLEAKSPMYAKVSETVLGLEHIRAFGWEDEVLNKSLDLLDYSQVSVYYMMTIQRWLLMVMDLCIMAIVMVLVSIAAFWTSTASQSSIGLGLLATTEWNLAIMLMLDVYTRLETSLGAAERLRAFVAETPTEKDNRTEPVPNWPSEGAVTFENVVARYSEDSQHKALDDVSTTIPPGQKVGIVGRTGSGKSSFILTLLNTLHYEGSVLVDGVEIGNVPRHQLRQAITTITQDSFELKTSVRVNMLPQVLLGEDTEDEKYDDQMEAALKQVNLWNHVDGLGGLKEPLTKMEFSTGQKQLFSLARAILHHSIFKSKVVLIDEATSSIDRESDQRMQQVMKTSFAGCTRLVIAHRLKTIADADIKITMSDGKIVEGDENQEPESEEEMNEKEELKKDSEEVAKEKEETKEKSEESQVTGEDSQEKGDEETKKSEE